MPANMPAKMNDYLLRLTSLIYQKALAEKSPRTWAWLRKILIRFLRDPECLLSIHGRMLYLPLSHALPQYLAAEPLYDSLLGRLAAYLRQREGRVCVVDVGANIGDTIAAFFDPHCLRDRYLGLEPNPCFRSFLLRNWGGEKNVTILPYFCTTDRHANKTYRVVEYDGTAEFLRSETGSPLEDRTLTRVIAEQPDFESCNLIKIDTDGHDFDVIRGGSAFIRKNLPAVCFECAPMSRPEYLQECISTLEFFAAAGYRTFFAYDNVGHLIGKFCLSDLSAFTNIIAFQLISRLFFMDILVMKEEYAGLFGREEIQFHVSKIKDEAVHSELNRVLTRFIYG